jgi:hypothetical protein
MLRRLTVFTGPLGGGLRYGLSFSARRAARVDPNVALKTL